MKKATFYAAILSAALIGYYQTAKAQNWTVLGNAAVTGNFLGTTNAHDLRFRTNNTQRMIVTSGGNVGIGLTTPSAKFHAYLSTATASTPVAYISTLFDGNENRLALTGFGLDTPDGALSLNGANTNDVTLAMGGGDVILGKDANSTLSMRGSIQSGLRFDAATGDKISLFGDRINASNMYGFGIESTTLYYKSMGNYRWYINKNADGGAGAAMTLSSTGRLGIGTTSPLTRLNVVSNESVTAIFNSTFRTLNTPYSAIVATAYGAPGNSMGMAIDAEGGYCGIYAIGYLENSAAQGGNVFGVRGIADGANAFAGNRYGIYGEAEEGAFNAAGYFVGDVYGSRFLNPSDKRLKNNIEPMTGSLGKLMKLKPSTYLYKTEEYRNMNLPEDTQLGLIADELESIFPELVKEQVQPEQLDRNKNVIKPSFKFKGVNYIGLIPVLVSSVQEQQGTIHSQDEQINQQNQKIEVLEKEIAALKKSISPSGSSSISLSDAHLEQNAPNPFSENTTIFYFIPETAGSATLKIYSLNGEEIRSVDIQEKGKGSLIVNAGSLSQGTYSYQLVVNNQTIDTKLMVITK